MAERRHAILTHHPYFAPYDAECAALAAIGVALEEVSVPLDQMDPAALARCHILLNMTWRVTAEVMDRMPRLRQVSVYAIGTDMIDLAAATERAIIVTNVPAATVDEVANHAAALILASIRRIPQLDRRVREGHYDWAPLRPSHNPRGRTLGLVAFGNIARALARKMASGFGMRVIAHDPHVPPDAGASLGVRLTTLEEVMAESDVISVHVPRTPASYHLIGEAALRLVKPTTHLVSTSRGGVIDEAALIRALEEGRLAGAALDVQEREPLPPDDPLLRAPNLIVTPHCAGYSVEGVAEMRRQLIADVVAVLQDRWPRHVVNPAVRPKLPLAGPPPGQ